MISLLYSFQTLDCEINKDKIKSYSKLLKYLFTYMQQNKFKIEWTILILLPPPLLTDNN